MIPIAMSAGRGSETLSSKSKMKVCILCEHFYYESATPSYSEYTPGGPGGMGCHKEIWTMDEYDETEESYRTKMATAETCEHFKHYKGETWWQSLIATLKGNSNKTP